MPYSGYLSWIRYGLLCHLFALPLQCSQVDFLQQANKELEAKLSQAEVKNSELSKEAEDLGQKNSRMCAELAEIGELVKQLSKEKVAGERSLQERAVHAEVRGLGKTKGGGGEEGRLPRDGVHETWEHFGRRGYHAPSMFYVLGLT